LAFASPVASFAQAPVQVQEIPLNSGWNLVSIQVAPAGGYTPAQVQASIVNASGAPVALISAWNFSNPAAWVSFQAANANYPHDLAAVAPGNGYWVHVNQASFLRLTNTTWEGAVQVRPGWNLVSFPGLRADSAGLALEAIFRDKFSFVQQVWSYDSSPARQRCVGYDTAARPALKELTTIEPGKAYWVFSTASAAIDLTNAPAITLPPDIDNPPLSTTAPRAPGPEDAGNDLNGNGALDDSFAQDTHFFPEGLSTRLVSVLNQGYGRLNWFAVAGAPGNGYFVSFATTNPTVNAAAIAPDLDFGGGRDVRVELSAPGGTNTVTLFSATNGLTGSQAFSLTNFNGFVGTGLWRLSVTWGGGSGRGNFFGWDLQLKGTATYNVTGAVATVTAGVTNLLPGALVMLTGHGAVAQATTGADGRFVFTNLTANDFSLLLSKPGFAPVQQDFDLFAASKDLGTLVTGAVGATQLASGAVTSAKLGSAAVGASALDLANLSTSLWIAGGNAGTTAGTHFLGTTDNVALDLKANSVRALRLEPNTSAAPNIIGGAAVNSVSSGVVGATIAGGGAGSFNGTAITNVVKAHFGFIGGGVTNIASGFEAVVGGGELNDATGAISFVGGATSTRPPVTAQWPAAATPTERQASIQSWRAANRTSRRTASRPWAAVTSTARPARARRCPAVGRTSRPGRTRSRRASWPARRTTARSCGSTRRARRPSPRRRRISSTCARRAARGFSATPARRSACSWAPTPRVGLPSPTATQRRTLPPWTAATCSASWTRCRCNRGATSGMRPAPRPRAEPPCSRWESAPRTRNHAP